MDLFATILVTITAVTICGICLFIFVCAFQPKFLRKLHGKPSRTYQDANSNASNENDDVKSLDVAIQSGEPPAENSSTSPVSNGRNKKVYLKSLERSLRTGRRIQDEDNDDNNNNENTSSNFLSRFINKYIRRRTMNTNENPEL